MPTPNQLREQFDTAAAQLRKAERAYVNLAAKAFPIGMEVTYSHGKNVIHGEVIGHTPFAARLKVRGLAGTEYWIGAERIL